MIKWFKTFLKDFGNLPRFQFFQKYVLPGLAIFFTWGTVGHLYLTTIKKDLLVKNTGQVEIIEEIAEGGRYNHQSLIIKLSHSQAEFRVPDEYKRDYFVLQQEIRVGDTITIYTRHLWQAILGFGTFKDVYQIEKGKETLFYLFEVIDEKKSQLKLFSIFACVLWVWYIAYRRNR
jgi:hypothetical protein